jgi:hypothetical protein
MKVETDSPTSAAAQAIWACLAGVMQRVMGIVRAISRR